MSPPRSRALREAVSDADAVLVATPEYNHSLPGALKNAIDWLSRPIAESPFKGKTIAVVGASTGMFGAVWAQAEARKVFGAVGGRVIDAELPVVFAHEQFDDQGRLTDPDVQQALTEQLATLVDAARGVCCGCVALLAAL